MLNKQLFIFLFIISDQALAQEDHKTQNTGSERYSLKEIKLELKPGESVKFVRGGELVTATCSGNPAASANKSPCRIIGPALFIDGELRTTNTDSKELEKAGKELVKNGDCSKVIYGRPKESDIDYEKYAKFR